jgi:hypothetical protein
MRRSHHPSRARRRGDTPRDAQRAAFHLTVIQQLADLQRRAQVDRRAPTPAGTAAPQHPAPRSQDVSAARTKRRFRAAVLAWFAEDLSITDIARLLGVAAYRITRIVRRAAGNRDDQPWPDAESGWTVTTRQPSRSSAMPTSQARSSAARGTHA